MLDPLSSQRLTLLRFPLIVGVVFIHNYATQVQLTGRSIGQASRSAVVDYVQSFVSHGVAHTAVPLFLMMSGYLFFLGGFSADAYRSKLRSRVGTLLIPFLVWNLAMLLIKATSEQVPSLRMMYSGRFKAVAEYTWIDYPINLIGIGQMPLNYQFWFIRDLLLLVVASPLIYLALRQAPRLFLLAAVAFWFFLGDLSNSTQSLPFFALGAWWGLRGRDPFFMDSRGPLLSLCWLALVAVDAADLSPLWDPFLHRFGILVGIFAVLYLTRLAAASSLWKEALLTLAGASFFVYAAHEPLLTIVRKFTFRLLHPESGASILSLYFVLPVLVITGLVAAYFALARHAPGFTALITGGHRDRRPATA